MNEDTLNNIINSIQGKVGEEMAGTIADDIALLITENNITIQNSQNKDTEIENLKKQNKTLITTNGNLLQQISYPKPNEDTKPNEEEKEIKITDIFDEKGNFK